MMITSTSYLEILDRIRGGLNVAARAVAPYAMGQTSVSFKSGDDPVTEADRLLDGLLRDFLVRDGEGWLSEETQDDLNRLDKSKVWIVDPLDGTREFVQHIPEWCISIAYVENGTPIAGGICNPATGEMFLGSLETGVTLNGEKVRVSNRDTLTGATVLASRSELKRGDWQALGNTPFEVTAMGSVAYKLARVAAGLADATWTLVPKHEWDIAAGAALVNSAGGLTCLLDRTPVAFNSRDCLLPHFLASSPQLAGQIEAFLEQSSPTAKIG